MSMSHRSARPRRQRGQAIIEYALVCAALALVLFVPIADTASGGVAKSTVELILDGFRKGFQRFGHAISLPA